jgi:hypothetical protein
LSPLGYCFGGHHFLSEYFSQDDKEKKRPTKNFPTSMDQNRNFLTPFSSSIFLYILPCVFHRSDPDIIAPGADFLPLFPSLVSAAQ